MEYTLQLPDNITLSGKTQAYSYMKDGRNRTADTVLYKKYLGDEWYYVVQAVPDTKAKTLYIVSAFKNKNQYKKEASQLTNANSPNATSKNGSVVTSKNSIPQSEQKSNSSDKKTSEKDSEKQYALDIDSDEDITGAEVMSWAKKSEGGGKFDIEVGVEDKIFLRKVEISVEKAETL